MKHIESYLTAPFPWSSLNIKTKAGYVLLNIGLLGPFYMSLRMIIGFTTTLSTSADSWVNFFNYAAPIQLLFTACAGEIIVNFFLIKKSRIAWFLTLITALWIGVQDSIASVMFLLKFPDAALFPMATVVTTTLLIGTFLTKDYVFEP